MFTRLFSTITFDSAFFILFGLLSLIMGILNKGKSFFAIFPHRWHKTKDKNYDRLVNIVCGITFILLGLLLIKRNIAS